MSNIKYLIAMAVCSLFSACKVPYVPEPYKLNAREVNYSPYGNWVEINYVPETGTVPGVIAGELLALEQDSIFLLTGPQKYQSISREDIVSAALCTHRSRSGTYLLLTVLFSAPAYIGAAIHPGFASNFIYLGIPPTLNGSYHFIKEGISGSNFLLYPKKNTLEQFHRFARYPGGLPEHIDFENLHLKQTTVPNWKIPPPVQVDQ